VEYYRARYYDPRVGRFVSEDPVRFPAGANLYGYAENNPALLVDPLGLEACGSLPFEKCPPGTASSKGGRGGLCCKKGRWAICVDADEYPRMSPRVRECLRRHETYHAEQRPEKKCDLAPCTLAQRDDWWTEECPAKFITYMCFLNHDERLPDGTSAAAQAAKDVATCMQYGWPSWPMGAPAKRY
jgi:uncharacterized protein RhaS with RHS repeats